VVKVFPSKGRELPLVGSIVPAEGGLLVDTLEVHVELEKIKIRIQNKKDFETLALKFL
jgi:hypothetical protein